MGWASAAKLPIAITISPQGDRFTYNVGQYGPGDEAWLRQKVLQYPPATPFKVMNRGNEAQYPEMKEAREFTQTMVRASGRELVQ